MRCEEYRVKRPFVIDFIIFNTAFNKSLPLLFTIQVFISLQKADAYLIWSEVLFASQAGTIVLRRELSSAIEQDTLNI